MNIGPAIAANDNNRVVINGLLIPGSGSGFSSDDDLVVPVPVGLEWIAGLGFVGIGIYWLLRRRATT